uniref:Nucleotidyltransferase domain-containing protein n=1 Tax=Candidatus Kentrum sp. SD TaxID=2126332 RepID=A0A450YZ93_9GAMM|nr:MAG: Nucleotidyltransferase domain-containing protein [Candidatus Kentron sp. SD]VFK46865.1 MAG: Nucleotidyltransferase domain-containing protein [Candidatus Kentron sp. SD]VFK78761.1 MAG: Nucleotidyltransferase domain-containing protein [Candidatus Kentron sp. SD]
MSTLDLPKRYLIILRELLASHAPSAEVWAYGSRVNGEAHAASDLDLVLRDPGDLARPQAGLSALKAALSESSIPILVDARDWARLPGSFHDEIRKAYVVVVSR